MEQGKFRILLVENSEFYREQFTRAIQSAIDAQILYAHDGQVALDLIFGAWPPDLILLDCNLPGICGKDVLKRVRSHNIFDNLPIICIAANSDIETSMETLRSGANDFVAKDASTGVIIARIKTQMRHKLALDRLNRMAIDRDLFAAGVLHDIRNIETTIAIVCEFIGIKLNKDPLKFRNEISDNLDVLIKSASRLGHYASDVIKTIRATDHTLTLTGVSLANILDWATDLVTNKGAESTLDRIQWESNQNLFPVLADLDFLKIAIFNIVQNSAKYRHPDRRQRLIISQEQLPAIDNPTKSRIITRIRDFGMGVHSAELKKIFEPFRRGSSQEKGTGFGLGLSMVTNVIARMGGKVWAESPEDGVGLVICFELAAPE